MPKMVTINATKLNTKMNNLVVNFPRQTGLAGYEFMKRLQRNLRRVITARKHNFRGKLWNSIQARKKNKVESYLVMSKTGVYLDRMTPHVVWLKRGRVITQWAKAKSVKGFIMHNLSRKTGREERGIYVKPHPFFNDTYSNTLLKLNEILRRREDVALKL